MNGVDRLCEEAEALLRDHAPIAAFDLLVPTVKSPDAPPRALWLAGHIARLTGHSDVAEPLLQRALSLAPAQAVIYEDLALAQNALRRPDLARAVLRRGLDAATAPGPLHAVLAALALDAMDTEEARRHLAQADTFAPRGDHSGSRALLAIHDHDWPTALTAAAAALGLPPPDLPKGRSAAEDAAPVAPPRQASPRGIALATSLSPRGGAAQRDAVETWRGFATDLISVNSPAEIALLAPDHPDVRFVATARDGRALFGRPLIFIDDILDALATSDAAIGGIVNADIRLISAPRLADDLRGGAHVLTPCHRVDLSLPDDAPGTPYLMGFDAFFFPRARIADLRGSRLALGAPWWDYLFPILALSAGLPMRIPEPGALGHVVHPINWSAESFVSTAGLWMEAILPRAAHAPPLREFLHPLAETYGTRHRLLGQDLGATRTDLSTRAAELGVLATMVSHLIRTQAMSAKEAHT